MTTGKAIVQVTMQELHRALKLPDNVDIVRCAIPFPDPHLEILVIGECCPVPPGWGNAVERMKPEDLVERETKRRQKLADTVINVGDKFMIKDDFKNYAGYGDVLLCGGINIDDNGNRILFYKAKDAVVGIGDTQVRKITTLA